MAAVLCSSSADFATTFMSWSRLPATAGFASLLALAMVKKGSALNTITLPTRIEHMVLEPSRKVAD